MTSSSSNPYRLFGGPSLTSFSRRHFRSGRLHHRNSSSTMFSTVLRPMITNNSINSRLVVDVNNNDTITATHPMNDSTNITNNNINNNSNSDLLLDRMAILKAFGPPPVHQSTMAPLLCNRSTKNNRISKFEKPTSAREARRVRHQQMQRKRSPTTTTTYDPAVEQEFLRLRDSVPSIAGHNVSDLTIINEAISLICDLESQLLHKLRCQLPELREQFIK